MAATAWTLYNRAKYFIGNGTLQLGTTTFKLKLCTSASNAETLTVSTFAGVTQEISIRGGYVANGKALTTMVWNTGASAKQYKFDADDVVFTASGSSLINVKYAVIGVSNGKVLCYSKLSTSAFTITSPNTLTIQMNSAGIFTMV